MDLPRQITVPAFAKINWFLEILGKRDDGFHELRTLFQAIDLSDELVIERCPEPADRLEVEGRPCEAGPDNLVLQAVRLLRRSQGFAEGVRIRLRKRIPVAAGLGGGSSDAAASLLALNQLFGCGLRVSELARLGSRLGADVPFFLQGGIAAGWGRGDQIRPLADLVTVPALLVVFPGLAVSTADAYRWLQAAPLEAEERLTGWPEATTIQRLREVFATRAFAGLRNDLEAPVLDRYPALCRLKDLLLESGCGFAMLSGSGSSLFAVGPEVALQAAAQDCRSAGLDAVFVCRPFSRSEYLSRYLEAGIEPAVWGGLQAQ